MVDCGHQKEQHEHNSRRLALALVVILVFMVVEIAGGLISGSLALLADATHMFTDAVALALAVSAQYLATRPADARLNFGYRRAQVLAAFANGLFLIILLFWIVFEAVHRFVSPVDVDSSLMLGVAFIGLAANLVAFFILHRPHEETDLNMRGALLHVIGDLLGSVAAIIGAIIISTTGWLRIDPILSVIVAFLIGVSALRLLRETAHILLEGAPKGIDIEKLKTELAEASPQIVDVHDVQISQITPDQPRLTLHACVNNASDAAAALEKAKEFLEQRYQIRHSTIQIEVGECPDRHFTNEPGREHAGGHHHAEASSGSRVSGGASPALSAGE